MELFRFEWDTLVGDNGNDSIRLPHFTDDEGWISTAIAAVAINQTIPQLHVIKIIYEAMSTPNHFTQGEDVMQLAEFFLKKMMRPMVTLTSDLLRGRVMVQLVLLLTSCVLLSSCAGTERWREEVQLGDGRIIIIDREVLREGGGDEISINRTGTKPKEHRLRFTHPDKSSQKIEWRSTKFYKGSWPEKPLLLDLEEGWPIVFTEVGIGPAEAMYSKYVFRHDGWQEEKLQEVFPPRKPNLYLKTGIDMPSYVDMEQKLKDYQSYYPSYLRQIGPKLKMITDY